MVAADMISSVDLIDLFGRNKKQTTTQPPRHFGMRVGKMRSRSRLMLLCGSDDRSTVGSRLHAVCQLHTFIFLEAVTATRAQGPAAAAAAADRSA